MQEGRQSSHNEDGWEDIEELPRTGPLFPKTPPSARRRKPHGQWAPAPQHNVPLRYRIRAAPRPVRPAAQQAPPSHHQTMAIGTAPDAQVRLNQQEAEEPRTILSSFLLIYSFFKGIFFIVIKLLRWPLAFFVFAWLLDMDVTQLGTTLTNRQYPFCNIPAISSFPFCRLSSIPSRADYPRLVEIQNNMFDRILDETSAGSTLALEIRRSELATADLAALVRVSGLTSKEQLADTLVQFVEESKVSSRSLQKLSSKVGGAVDAIMAVNDHALRGIAAAQASESSRYSLRALLPGAHTQKRTNELVLNSFNSAMETNSRHVKRLIIETQASITSLDKLEERLGKIHALVVIGDKGLSGERDELLALLWTRLGGNKKVLKNAEEHLRLLREVGVNRKKAFAHIKKVMQTLEGMGGNMDDLRERVAAPKLAGDQIPVEVHMQSIQNGLERLREGRSRAREVEKAVTKKIVSDL